MSLPFSFLLAPSKHDAKRWYNRAEEPRGRPEKRDKTRIPIYHKQFARIYFSYRWNLIQTLFLLILINNFKKSYNESHLIQYYSYIVPIVLYYDSNNLNIIIKLILSHRRMKLTNHVARLVPRDQHLYSRFPFIYVNSVSQGNILFPGAPGNILCFPDISAICFWVVATSVSQICCNGFGPLLYRTETITYILPITTSTLFSFPVEA